MKPKAWARWGLAWGAGLGLVLGAGLGGAGLGGAARAQEPPPQGGQAEAARAQTPWRPQPLRGWVDMLQQGLPRPYVCGAVDVGGAWSLESCGSGAGLFSEAQGVEVAHMRARWRKAVIERGDAEALDVLSSAGLMEVQRGQDQAGVRFDSDGVEASGVEAALSVRWWRRGGDGTWWKVQVDVGAGWVPDVGAVVEGASPWVPFSLVEMGFGF